MTFSLVRGLRIALVALTLLAGLVSLFAATAPAPLLLLTPGADPAGIKTDDATVTARGAALLIVTGTKKQWPGITIPAPGHWDLSPFGFVEMQVKNVGRHAVAVTCRVDNEGANGTDNCVSGSARVEPGQVQILKVDLKRSSSSKMDGKLFGMRGYPVALGGKGTINPATVTQLLVFVTKPGAEQQFEISNIRATGTHTVPTAWVTDAKPFFPFVDTLGQYKHKDWPGKTRSVADLSRNRKAEASDLAANPGPADWDKYGGWAKGPQLKATGFFRPEKSDGKWWLVTPEGRLFFSAGIDCVGARHYTAIDERAAWFEDFPGASTEFKQLFGSGYALKGDYAGRTPKTFSFSSANLHRKYGANWQEELTPIIHQRLRSWGLNTIAMWSDEKIRLARKTPYVDSISSRRARPIGGTAGYWAKFPDPFDPALAPDVQRQMEAKKGRSAGDPWCIGYFSDNEMSWGDDLSLVVGALCSPADQPAKQAFISDLQVKYGTIEKLNGAWGAEHASWEAVLQATNAPDKKRAEADLAAFYTRAAEQYFRTMREAIKQAAPQQLYLGCRFAWVNARAAAAGAKYCDVVSYNLYKRDVADFQFNGGADVPLIIGEFHFGALDRGMFHTGLVPVATQQARAEAYRSYVEGALKHPQFVGSHWFEYQDEPLTGRVLDEENYQIGFVDGADTPYAETIAAARDIGARLYKVRSGK